MSNVERIPVQRYEQEELMLNNEAFAKECLVHISVNNERVTTLLASPDDLLDLAIGHLAVEHAFRPSNSNVNHRIVEGKNEYSVDLMVKTSHNSPLGKRLSHLLVVLATRKIWTILSSAHLP